MLLYKLGKIVYKKSNNLIFENKGDGYLVIVSDESRYKINEKVKLYLYEYITEYNKTTYGFKDFNERLLFLDLISIDKIGPKIAMGILDKGWENVVKLITQENWQEISKFPFVNESTARLLCVELSEKWTKIMNCKSKDKSSSKLKINKLKEILN
ncbi:Holliday junction DNA helicase RuvA [Mycoplasmopsis citelli]|uniref:Holliday junction DNA helicase RuvA n=1 Tax=Mycoplasmopsis citelli TaxID=171281 RepID=A0A449B2J2_9BACT|nr:Holliday junction branch migration protein RuvA [Mycoplasmopsis citelli]VEU74827.1 Holliday junction DNA helicase RuvA [Mycoplasmopsis citelli]